MEAKGKMSETSINLRVQFREESVALQALETLVTAATAHGHDLSAALASITPQSGAGQAIDIERLEREGAFLAIAGYAGRIDPPLWLIPALVHLGATRTVLSESADDGGTQYHFIGLKKVSRKAFETSAALMAKPPLPPSTDLFLPEGRVSVKATLLSHEWKESRFERYCVMRMQAEDGRHFIYKGASALTAMTADDQEKTCTFSAVFELGEYDGQCVSFAQRPTKVQLGSIAPAKVRKVPFTGRNQAFMADVFGPLITYYFDELGGKPDAFIQRMGAASILGMGFTELPELLSRVQAYSFDGFGHCISLSNGNRESFEIYTVGNVAVDLEAARRHLNSMNVSATYRDDSEHTYTLFWAQEGMRVRFKVWARGFECFLDRETAVL